MYRLFATKDLRNVWRVSRAEVSGVPKVEETSAPLRNVSV
jgi:hypothetical protein